MPYKTIDELPSGVKNNLPSHGANIYLNAFNSAKNSGKDDSSAAKIAWSAVENKFHKDKDGKWSPNAIHEYSMFINKAILDENGKMIWNATGSDTKKDSFDEKMSVPLFNSFMEQIKNGINLPIYLSLAHYPRLSGKGEAGIATDIYLDGDILKGKGYFNDSQLGVRVYNAVRKDRRDNVPQDKRVRISIGFYDQMHQHENGYVWKYESGVDCPECEKNPRGGKTYLKGILEHFAVTRVPVNKRTDIVAKSEGDMTTRYDDALSIVEDADLVADIEKSYSEEPVERSLIEKSDVGNAADIAQANPELATQDQPAWSSYNVLNGLPKEKLLKLFNHMLANGEIEDDDLSLLINQVFNQTSDRSKAKDDGDGPDKEPDNDEATGQTVTSQRSEKKKTLKVAGQNPESNPHNNIAGYTETSKASKDKTKNIAAGKSKTDEKETPSAQKSESDKGIHMESQVQNSAVEGEKSTNDTQPDTVKQLGMLEELLNLMRQLVARPASVATTGEVVSNAQEPQGEFNQPLPTSANDFTTQNNQSGPGSPTGPESAGTWDENSPLKGVVSSFSEALANTVNKSGNERLAAFQDAINQAGEQLKSVHASLAATETKPEGQNSNVESVVNQAVEAKMAPVLASLAELANIVRGLTVAKSDAVEKKEVPVMKSIVMNTQVPVAPKAMSIADIASRTTIGTLGK